MKKYLLVLAISLSHLVLLRAQQIIVLNHRGCGFIESAIPSSIKTSDPSDAALEYVKRICNITGITQAFVVRQGFVANAYSTTNDKNERLILYNEDFFSGLNSETYKIIF
jgi:hypothetical protein